MVTIPRKNWGPAEYAVAFGRDQETYMVLKNKVATGMMSLADARQAAENQGFDPDQVGKLPQPETPQPVTQKEGV